jgi:uncharacterized protein (DUF1697 family)
MTRYVALLRGINVGGRNKVAMADLRQIAESLGHTEVATYIQSGNLVFTNTGDSAIGDNAIGDSAIGLADALEQEIARSLAVRPAVVVLSRADLTQVIADNPFPGESNPKALHAFFHREPITDETIAAVSAAEQRAQAKGSRDEAAVVGCTLFVRTPDGLGRSELAAQLARSVTKTAGTARNWATVNRLLEMLDPAT